MRDDLRSLACAMWHATWPAGVGGCWKVKSENVIGNGEQKHRIHICDRVRLIGYFGGR